MSSLLTLHAEARPSGQAVALLSDAPALDWATLWARVAGVAADLSTRPGRRWCLAAEAAPDFLVGLLGLLHAGKHPVVPANFQPASLAACAAGCDGTLDAAGIERAGLGSPRTLAPLAPEASLELTTSGSTGQAKPVTKRLDQLDAEVAALETLWGQRLGTGAVYATVPHFHIYGLLFRLLWPLAAGRPFDAQMAANPHELLHRMQAHGRGAVVSSPAHLSRLADLLAPEALAPHLVACFSSGAPLAAETAAVLGAGLGQAPIEVYGSTETGGIAWRTQWPEAGAPWQALPGVEVEFDAEGRLKVRSPFTGSPDPIAVGDLGESLSGGRFHLRGRADRIVKLEGKRIALPALEQQLAAHPWVQACAVVPLAGRRAQLGAVVELSPAGLAALAQAGRRAAIEQLKAHLLAHQERVALPRRWRFPAALPYNERGKLPLDALIALFEEAEHEPA